MSGRPVTVVLWLVTAWEVLTMGVAGLSKFGNADFWTSSFVAWGYPPWMSSVIGALEIAGALALLVPVAAIGGAGLLVAIMAVALVTVLTQPNTLGWAAPVMHLVLLSFIVWVRLARRRLPAR